MGFVCVAKNQKMSNIVYIFNIEGKDYKFQTKDFETELKTSAVQNQMLKNREMLIETLESFGLTKKEIVDYAFPEVNHILNKLTQKTNIPAGADDIQVVLNKCKIKFKEGAKGKFLDLSCFYDNLLEKFKTSSKCVRLNLIVKKYKEESVLKEDYVEKGCFKTYYGSSTKERKNNICVALSKFDGLVLEQGETLSFNSVTGLRNKEAGYQSAKIISGGTFVEGFGGGVCQVSTTLYNACLLAGLEILEVHAHSLPVSYVEPSFDAMVNTGSSDLVVRNNSGGKLIFTTSNENGECMVKIFGKKNKYSVKRISEKTKIIPAEKETIETDLKKYNLEELKIGEEKRLSYAKDGFCSSGYLNFYDDKGNLIETKKIRENRYNPVKGVVVKREN